MPAHSCPAHCPWALAGSLGQWVQQAVGWVQEARLLAFVIRNGHEDTENFPFGNNATMTHEPHVVDGPNSSKSMAMFHMN